LHYINKQDDKAYVIERMSVKYKLSDLKKKLEKNNQNLKAKLDEKHEKRGNTDVVSAFKLMFNGGDMDV